MTEKRSLGNYIMLDPTEVPSIPELEGAISALKRCEIIFAKLRRDKDPPARSMEVTADFLEKFIEAYRGKLRKNIGDVCIDGNAVDVNKQEGKDA